MGKTHANRGMPFEKMIEGQCELYEKQDRAVIRKIPTEFTIQRAGARIVSAFPKKKSTLDFIGDLQGVSIAIEAKSTKNKTSFPFANLHEHQISLINKWSGLVYYFVYFESLGRFFLCDAKHFQLEMETIGRKSFPLSWFEDDDCVYELPNVDFIEYAINDIKNLQNTK